MSQRSPIQTASPVVREFFTLFDGGNLGHDDLANGAGVSLFSLNRWRKGRSSPKVYDFECLCKVLGYRVVLIKEKEDVGGEIK